MRLYGHVKMARSNFNGWEACSRESCVETVWVPPLAKSRWARILRSVLMVG